MLTYPKMKDISSTPQQESISSSAVERRRRYIDSTNGLKKVFHSRDVKFNEAKREVEISSVIDRRSSTLFNWISMMTMKRVKTTMFQLKHAPVVRPVEPAEPLRRSHRVR